MGNYASSDRHRHSPLVHLAGLLTGDLPRGRSRDLPLNPRGTSTSTSLLLSSLPYDVLLHIYHYLSNEDRNSLHLACRAFSELRTTLHISPPPTVSGLELFSYLFRLRRQSQISRLRSLVVRTRNPGSCELVGLLPTFTALERLTLGTGVVVTTGRAELLTRLQCLTSLDLTGNPCCTVVLLRALASLPDLRELHITSYGIRVRDLRLLSTMPKLRVLSLRWFSTLHETLLSHLVTLTGLRSLDVSGSDLTDRDLRELASLTGLVTLDVSNCPLVEGHGFSALTTLHSLTTLGASGCSCDWDNIVCIGYLTSLVTLDISNRRGVNGWTVAAMADLVMQVVTEVVDGDTVVRRTWPVPGLPRLRSLDLGGCQRLGDGGVSFLPYLTDLERLSLDYCPRVTRAGLSSLGKMSSLRRLSLRGCRSLSHQAVTLLRSRLPDCDIVSGD